MTLRASGFWSLTLGFFLLMQVNQTPIPIDPGKITPAFSNQTQISGLIDDTSGKISVNVFESSDCQDCHAFATYTLMPLWRLYEHNPKVDVNVYIIPTGSEGALGEEMAKSLICAEEQQQFWPLYEQLHLKEELLTAPQMEALILEKELKVHLDSFKTCLSDEKTQATLEKHKDLAKVKQIEIYPTTLIQDVQFIHSQPLENLIRVIDKKAMEMNTSTL